MQLPVAEHLVRRKAEQPRHDLGERKVLAVGRLARVRRKQLDRRIGHASVRVDFEPKRRREAFALRIARL
ncbi:MAG: hypothetical protein ABWX95_08120, partial [Methyloceanibacter sp.]